MPVPLTAVPVTGLGTTLFNSRLRLSIYLDIELLPRTVTVDKTTLPFGAPYAHVVGHGVFGNVFIIEIADTRYCLSAQIIASNPSPNKTV